MNHPRILATVLATGFVASLSAQTVQTIPKGYLTTEGSSSSSYPFNTDTARVQYAYDSTHISFKGPVLISRLRVRANGSTSGTWTGGTLAGVTVQMSSSPFNWDKQTTTFATNHGKDLAIVFTGSVNVVALATGGAIPQKTWYVDIKLAKAFLYDPSLGQDLIIDYGVGAFTGGTRYSQDVTSSATDMASRMYSLSSATATTGSVQQNVGLITEITWVPAQGLYSSFSASPTIGSGPLKVQFKDTTFTSAPGGVKTWAWDFDGDSKIDSTLQNPTWTYATAGKTAQYSVSLTTTDGVNPSSKRTEPNFITVDPKPTCDFTATPVFGSTPLIVKFTDNSIGVNKWAWDFNNDTIVDSTVQNPSYPFVKPGTYTVKLSVSGVGGTASLTKTDFITAVGSTSNKSSADMLQYQFNEVRGNKVANTASTTALPGFGTAATTTWMVDAGRKGYKGPEAGAGALGNGGKVDTGWKPKVNTSLTIEWWHRTKSAPASTAYFFGNGTFRCFTGGVAGTALLFRGTNLGDIKTVATVQGNVGTWMHMALVIDGPAKKALWYVNGKLDSTTVLTAALSYDGTSATNNLSVGTSGTSTAATATYDMDDFRMYGTARTAAQVQADMLREVPTTSTFDVGCLGTLGVPEIGANAAPTTGNSSFAITIDKTESGKPGVLVLGGAAKKFANLVNLPLSLSGLLIGGTGCNLNVDVIMMLPAVGNGGTVTFPLPIPSTLTASHAYAQWITFGTKGAVSAGLDLNFQK